jgi:hypothetical protein
MKSSFLLHFSEKVEPLAEHVLAALKVPATRLQRSGAKLHHDVTETHEQASD